MFFRRRKPAITEEPHEAIIGQSGSGKTVFRSGKVPDDAKKGAVVICDPQKSQQAFSNRVLPILMGAMLWHKLVFESLAATEWVLAWQILKPSVNPDLVARAQEDEDAIRALAELVARRSNKPLHTTPQIEEWLVAAVTMLFASGAKFSWLPYCYLPESTEFDWMLRNHRTRTPVEHRNKLKWEAMVTLYRRTPKAFNDQVMHAARRVDAVFTTRFLLRCDGSYDIEAAIADGKILVFQGDPENEDATRTLLGSVIYRVIKQAVDERSPRCRLIIEEANNFGGQVNEFVCSALATKRQCNLAITLMVQHLDFPTPEILKGVMTNTQRQYFMRMGDPDTAKYAALAVGIPDIDFNAVLRTTERQVRIGEEEATLDGRKILKPVYGTEQIDHLMSSNDQLVKKQKELMELKAGWLIEKAFGKVRGPYYVAEPKKRWDGKLTSPKARQLMLDQEQADIARKLIAMRTQPPFVHQSTITAQWNQVQPQPKPSEPPTPKSGAAGRWNG